MESAAAAQHAAPPALVQGVLVDVQAEDEVRRPPRARVLGALVEGGIEIVGGPVSRGGSQLTEAGQESRTSSLSLLGLLRIKRVPRVSNIASSCSIDQLTSQGDL